MKQMIRERRQRQALEEQLREAQQATAIAEQGLQAAMDQLDVLRAPPTVPPRPMCCDAGTDPEPFFEESQQYSRELELTVRTMEASLQKEAQRRLEAEKEADRCARESERELQRVRDKMRLETEARVQTATAEAHRKAKELEAKLDEELMRGLSRHKEPEPDPRLAMTPQAMLEAETKKDSAILKLLRAENESLKSELAQAHAGSSVQEDRAVSLAEELNQLKQDRASRRASRRSKQVPTRQDAENIEGATEEKLASPPKSPLSPKAHNVARLPVSLDLKGLGGAAPVDRPAPLAMSGAGARF